MTSPTLQAHGQVPNLREYDLVAIGCGPFNLGLAALASTVPELSLAVFEQQATLRWHPGLLFDDALLQQSFLADLVTLIDPTHPLSFLAYLRAADRLYPFFIRERFHPTRREYEDYLRWAAAQLPNVHFSHSVESVAWDPVHSRYEVTVVRDGEQARVLARDLVIGIGTTPDVPAALGALAPEQLLHSSEYLQRSSSVDHARHVTLIGSGQSAAEIAVDLLRKNLAGGPSFSWLTRTPSFAPLDYSKLVLEMTTPDYVRYFHALPQSTKDRLNTEQWRHYRGISDVTLTQIHELLYEREVRGTAGLQDVELRCGVAVQGARMSPQDSVLLSCEQADTGARFEHESTLVIAATGYRPRQPRCLAQLERSIRRDAQGRYRVRLDYSLELELGLSGRIFVANAELHSHGVATPDLGTAAYRNGTILNAVLGREHYRLPGRTAFTTFASPSRAADQRVHARAEPERREPVMSLRGQARSLGLDP